MALQTYDLYRARPRQMSLSIVAGGVEAGRTFAGDAGAIDFSCGGLWSVKYQAVSLFKSTEHRYWMQLQALLNSRARAILVPLMSDWIAPVPTLYPPGTVTLTVPHSDSTGFSDGSLYTQPAITGMLGADAALNAGTLTITLTAGDTLYGGEIFAIQHPTKNWRCYCIQEVDSQVTNMDGSVTYVVGITPPLREAATNGTTLKWDRPLCYMRLAPGQTISWDPENFWKAKPDIAFLEAF